jgi:GTPase-associated system helical domain
LNRFGKASADAINAALTAVLKDLVPRIIPRIQDDNSKTVGLVNEALERGASGNNLRADLLYWKETLYSPAKKVSCRRLSPDAAATYWVAYDLHKQMTPLHPIRVEFFLRETLGAALGNNAAIEPVALEQFCCALGSELAPDGSWRIRRCGEEDRDSRSSAVYMYSRNLSDSSRGTCCRMAVSRTSGAAPHRTELTL